MKFKDFIKLSLEQASTIANTYFGKVSGTVKEGDNNQVLTEADIAIGKFLVGEVQKTFPDHNIIDEEAGKIDKKSNFTWVIDPIDGTSNFANGIPLYGIMIGLLENATPISGGIALSFFNEIIIAEKGKGAFLNNERLSVSDEKNLLSTLVAYGIDGHQENPAMTRVEAGVLAEIILQIRNLRSSNSCYDVAMVAKGKYGAFLNQTTKIWDNVAQQVIIEEAGGVYTDFFGRPMDYADPLSKLDQNFTVCAGAPLLHSHLQGIIHKKAEKPT